MAEQKFNPKTRSLDEAKREASKSGTQRKTRQSFRNREIPQDFEGPVKADEKRQGEILNRKKT